MKTIFILEDSIIISKLLETILIGKGYDVITCASVNCAHSIKKPIDFAILDYQLPDGTGLEVAEALRNKMPSLPMILLTARGSQVPTDQLETSGISQVVEKPVDSSAIVDIITNSLGTS